MKVYIVQDCGEEVMFVASTIEKAREYVNSHKKEMMDEYKLDCPYIGIFSCEVDHGVELFNEEVL